MSSLKATGADGYRYPPDFDPAKHGSLRGYRAAAARGGRAGGAGGARGGGGGGGLTVRFEAPFGIWCAGCGALCGKGVRFNAEKVRVGSYHSTPVWAFRMRLACCGQALEVRTDPARSDFVVAAGGQRRADGLAGTEAEGLVLELPSVEERERRRRDPMYCAAKKEELRAQFQEDSHRLRGIQRLRRETHAVDYESNRGLRAAARERRQEAAALRERGRVLGLGDEVRLLPKSSSDAQAAADVRFRATQAGRGRYSQGGRAKVLRGSIFAGAGEGQPPKKRKQARASRP